MSVFTLGDFTFKTFFSFSGQDGAPMLPMADSEELSRPNVKGLGFVRFPRKGRTFPMMSFIDLANDAQAAVLIANYHLAVMGNPVKIIWRSMDYFDLYGVKYQIRAISDVRSQRMTAGTGGLNPPSLSSVRAIWHLSPVEVDR